MDSGLLGNYLTVEMEEKILLKLQVPHRHIIKMNTEAMTDFIFDLTNAMELHLNDIVTLDTTSYDMWYAKTWRWCTNLLHVLDALRTIQLNATSGIAKPNRVNTNVSDILIMDYSQMSDFSIDFLEELEIYIGNCVKCSENGYLHYISRVGYKWSDNVLSLYQAIRLFQMKVKSRRESAIV